MQQRNAGQNTEHSAGESPRAVIGAARVLLSQCEEFVRAVPDSVYCAESRVLDGGTVGKHLRHLVDHYAAILHMHEQGGGGGAAIDYDHRERDVPMEACRATAIAALVDVSDRLAGIQPADAHRGVRIRVMVGADGREAELHSSLAREVAFATHHGVHHQAMMKAIAREFGVRAPEDFGKAPSTVQFEVARSGRAQ